MLRGPLKCCDKELSGRAEGANVEGASNKNVDVLADAGVSSGYFGKYLALSQQRTVN